MSYSNNNSFDYYSIYGGNKEPNIVKAQFYLYNKKVYNLEFDQNISMHDLKLMIQKAAHLKSKNFRIFSNCKEYTQYNNEAFESLFHEEKSVAFSIEINPGEESEETQLLLQMNCPCNLHVDKFLLYYCFTCGQSICSDCFTIGSHQGHKVQDKCFYLLPSKFLVEKLFQNWGQNPYEEYKFSEDQTLSDLRININTIIFDKLFEILKNIQSKVKDVIEKYHYTNYQLFERVRNSLRDIKVFCIKLLDDLKEKMNITDIVNNEQIFIDFDAAYKKLGQLQKNKFHFNYLSYSEFTQQIPTLLKNMVNDINDKLSFTLNQILNDERYDILLNQMKIKEATNFKPEEINKEVKAHIRNNYSDFTKKRQTINYIFPHNENNIKKNFENININDNRQGRKTLGPETNHINLEIQDNLKKTIYNNNIFSFGDNTSNNNLTDIQKENKEYPNLFNNNIGNNIQIKPKIISTTTTTTTIEEKILDIKPEDNLKGKIPPKISIKPIEKLTNIIVKESNGNVSYSSSSQVNRPIFHLEGTSINSSNQIPINVENQDNKQNIILTNNTLNDSFGSNNTIKNINQMAEENLKENKFITHINGETSSSSKNNTNNNEISNNIITSYIRNNNQLNLNNKFVSFRVNYSTIPEEVTESEGESSFGILKRFLNKEYILAPISQTKNIKLISSEHDEITLKMKFPFNLDINLFLLECAYCNYNKMLYITGGIKNNEKTNIALVVNLNRKEGQLNKLSSMNYYRACHSMIPYNKYLIVVGGDNQSSVERYNIIDNIWENLNPMNFKRAYPILVIYKEYLYAFFGKSNNNEYCNNIERIRLSNKLDENWEMVQYINTNNIDTRLYGCGTHIYNDYLYLFGGKCNEKTIDSIFYYNFEDNILGKESSVLELSGSFRENMFHKMGDKLVQISDEQYFGIFLKLV